MTEQEAKMKWCPMGQIAYQFYAGTGKSQRADCIGSECMLWRTDGQEEVEIGRGYGQPPDTELVDNGYCGLGGKP